MAPVKSTKKGVDPAEKWRISLFRNYLRGM
jgi:hypothetical protein